MTCPKCGAQQAAGDECIHCGVIFAKLRPRTPTTVPHSAPAPAQPLAPSKAAAKPVARLLQHAKELLRTAAPDVGQRVTFFSQMARLTGANVPVPEALMHVEAILGARALGRAAAAMRAEISAGGRLSQAMAARPWAFDALEVALIEGVESSGLIHVACAQLQARLEAHKTVQQSLISAFGYPLLVAVTACITGPVPRYLSAGPAAYAADLAANLLILVAFIGLAFFVLPAVVRHPRVLPTFLERGAHVPGLRSILLKRRFWLVFDAMTRALGAGIMPREALRLATVASGEPSVALAGVRATNAFAEGEAFASVFALLPGIDRETLALLAAAERSATLRQTFEEQAAHKRTAYDRQLSGLRTAIRVGLSAVLAVSVGAALVKQITAGLSDPLAGLSSEDKAEAERAFRQIGPGDLHEAQKLMEQMLPAADAEP